MDFSEVVRRRRSIRSYTNDRVDPALLDHLVDVARRAPTAGFAQGVDFLVLDDPDLVRWFWRITADPGDPDAGPGADDPLALVLVLSDPERYLGRYRAPDKIAYGLDRADAWPVPFWDVDAGMAAMLLQLAAVDAGLATWFFGVAHGEHELRSRLGVPVDMRLVGVVALGHRAPDETPSGSGAARPRRALAEQLHRNGW